MRHNGTTISLSLCKNPTCKDTHFNQKITQKKNWKKIFTSLEEKVGLPGREHYDYYLMSRWLCFCPSFPLIFSLQFYTQDSKQYKAETTVSSFFSSSAKAKRWITTNTNNIQNGYWTLNSIIKVLLIKINLIFADKLDTDE